MYYFKILDILEKSPDPLSVKDIYIILRQKNNRPNYQRLRYVLRTMFLNNDNIDRKSRVIQIDRHFHKEHVYFISKTDI